MGAEGKIHVPKVSFESFSYCSHSTRRPNQRFHTNAHERTHVYIPTVSHTQTYIQALANAFCKLIHLPKKRKEVLNSVRAVMFPVILLGSVEMPGRRWSKPMGS